MQKKEWDEIIRRCASDYSALKNSSVSQGMDLVPRNFIRAWMQTNYDIFKLSGYFYRMFNAYISNPNKVLLNDVNEVEVETDQLNESNPNQITQKNISSIKDDANSACLYQPFAFFEGEVPEDVISELEDKEIDYQLNDDKTILKVRNLKKIPAHLFRGDTNLIRIEIPQTVTIIGSRAFDKCLGLENITIPKNVTLIGRKVFLGCMNLKKIVFPAHFKTESYLFAYLPDDVEIEFAPDSLTESNPNQLNNANVEDIRQKSDDVVSQSAVDGLFDSIPMNTIKDLEKFWDMMGPALKPVIEQLVSGTCFHYQGFKNFSRVNGHRPRLCCEFQFTFDKIKRTKTGKETGTNYGNFVVVIRNKQYSYDKMSMELNFSKPAKWFATWDKQHTLYFNEVQLPNKKTMFGADSEMYGVGLERFMDINNYNTKKCFQFIEFLCKSLKILGDCFDVMKIKDFDTSKEVMSTINYLAREYFEIKENESIFQ